MMQTKWVKQRIQQQLQEMAQHAGVTVSIEAIEGNLPFEWTLHNVYLELSAKDTLRVEKIKIRLAFFPLFRKEIAIHYVSLSKGDLLFSEEGTTPFSLSVFDLPFHLSIKTFKMDNAHATCFETGKEGFFSLRARGKLGKQAQNFFSQIKWQSDEALADFFIKGDRKKETLESLLTLKVKSLHGFAPFFEPPFDTECALEVALNSSWKNWMAPSGSIKGQFKKLEIPNLKWLNRTWDINSRFSLSAEQEVTFSSLCLKSNLVEINAQGDKKSGVASLSIPNLSLLNLYTFAPLQGSLLLDARYDPSTFFIEAHTEKLWIGKQSYDAFGGILKAQLEQDLWKGKMEFLAKNKEIPVACHSTFFAKPGESLTIQNFELSAPETLIAGNVQINLLEKAMKGSLFAQALDLKNFQRLAPSFSGLQGSAGIHLELRGQDAHINCLLHDFSYFNTQIGQATCDVDLFDLFSRTVGNLSVELTDAAKSSLHVNALHFKTSFDGTRGPYSFSAKGSWRKDLEVASSGSWTINSLDVDRLQGFALGESFFLRAPVLVAKESQRVQIDMGLGQGALFLAADFDQKTLEVETNFKAADDQFLKCSALLPINYSLSPLDIKFDKTRNSTAELQFEGELEKIFDFINIGSHRLGGLLSCHLFLSNHLLKPSLKGHLEVRKGIYENEYTGTKLKEIEAILSAEGNQLLLSSFTARDAQGGKVVGCGTLQLNPQLNYPYEISAELFNLNLLHFDRGSSNFTGPFLIHGDTKAAHAQGTITASKADLSIPDTIPIDLPVLPVAYVNRPPYLDPSCLQPLPVFPLTLDLNLAAPGPIYVRGRGLRSEWKGSAHVSGSNVDIAATGQLTLIKGEFHFSGKAFALTQGEIILSDKPSQNAYLNLRGELAVADATIIVLLNGPISSPLLTFQSIPYMPTSSILAHILFNKDISEISPFQAIQIAQTIVTLSGGAAPDVLEKIRKGLGVDRLNIVSGQGDPNNLSLQIGKYLTKGIMVTLSQGVDSSQVIVEVDLKHGFLLQAESQQNNEGKFSLKWNKNY